MAHPTVLIRARRRRAAVRRRRRGRALPRQPLQSATLKPPRRPRWRPAWYRRRQLRQARYLGRRARPRLWWAASRLAGVRRRRRRPFQTPAQPNGVVQVQELSRLVGSFQRGGGAVRVDRVAKLVRRDLTRLGAPPLTLFYRLFTTLGARVVRRGGSPLRLPTVHTAQRGCALARRWVKLGVARTTSGGRTWSDRLRLGLTTGAAPAALAARNEFTSAAVVNRAYL